MNFKKFISGVSALAIAASAFVGMAVTANAEAVTAFSQDFTAKDDSTAPADYGFDLTYGNGSSASLVNYSVTDGELKCVSGPYANKNDGARTGTATATFDAIGTGNVVTVSYKWELGSATGNASGSYTKTRIGNASGNALELAFYGSDSGKLKVNGTDVYSNTNIRNTTYTVNATLNMTTQKITGLTLTCSNTSYSYTATEPLSFASPITTVDRFAFENSERQSWANTSKVDNINITYEVLTVPTYTITTNYIDEDGATVKTATTATVAEGEAYVPTYDATFDDDDYRYTYVSNTTIDAVTADASVNVVYSKAALAEHTVTAKATGDYEATLGVYTVKDAKSVTYPFSKYILSGTTLYSTGTSGTNTHYKKTVSNVTENVESTVAYTTSKTNVVYYADGADASGLTATEAGNIGIRCSNGTGGYAASDATITTLPAGKYKITIAPYGNQGTTFMAYAGSKDTDALVKAPTSANITEHTSDEFVLSDNTDIIIAAAGNAGSSPKVIDYIYIVRTDDYTAPATNNMGDVATAVLSKGAGVNTFAAQAATWVDGGKDGASVWEATATGATDQSYTKIVAIAENKDGETADGFVNLPGTFTTTGSVTVYIAVNAAMEDITSLTVRFE